MRDDSHDHSSVFIAISALGNHRSESSREQLLDAISDRIEQMTRRMMRHEREVARWEETADIAQMARLKIWNAMDELESTDPESLMAVAAKQIRWLLIDRARKHRGPQSYGKNHASVVISQDDDSPSPLDLAGQRDRPGNYEHLHEAVDLLPSELRSIIDLVYYHGMTQSEVAEFLGVAEKTVQRRNKRAQKMLADQLGLSVEEIL